MIDEQELSTKDFVVRFKGMQENLADQAKLRDDFLRGKYSKASMLIQNLANTYARDAPIIAYRAKVNTEMLRLEKHLKALGNHTPNRLVIEKQLPLLKRSHTFS
jgi:hypothetical protein